MSEQELIANALEELKESVTKMVMFKKALTKDTKKGAALHNYRILQDTYLNLEQSKAVVQRRLNDWELLLPEDADGDIIYPDVDEGGFEFTPVKSEQILKDTMQTFENAEIAMAKFVVSLTPTQYMSVRRDVKIMVIGEIDYARRLLGPPDDEDSDSSTLVPQAV